MLLLLVAASAWGQRIERDLVYGRTPQQELKLDLYLPAQEGAAPVVVWVHGGAWRTGSKARTPAERLVARGYAVASIEYRLSGVAKFPAQIEDCKAAVRWLRGNAAKYDLDPERIGAWGSSAGGHLAALLGVQNDDPASRVQAVVDFYGPTELLKMDAQGSAFSHDAPDSPESQLIGGPIQQHAERTRLANPVSYVSRGDPPFLIVHGDRDYTVPVGQSRVFYDALRAAGVPAKLEIVPGAGHGFHNGPYIDPLVDAFLDQHLKTARTPRPLREWADPNRYAPPGTRYATFFSRHAKREASYLIALPEDYETSMFRYPVIYWLHGAGGSQRSGAAYIRRPRAIVVFVNGLTDSMYCDRPEFPVESVIVRDLAPHVDATWRTIPDRAARAVEGFSMGGFGAAHLGFKYPEVFGVVVSMAGPAPDAAAGAGIQAIVKRIFGGDRARFEAERPVDLARRNAAAIRGRSRVFLGVGSEDRLRAGVTAMHEALDQLGIAHQFHVAEGVAHQAQLFTARKAAEIAAFYREAFGQ